MGSRAGIKGGVVHGKALKAGGKYVVPGYWLPANTLNTRGATNTMSGIAAAFGPSGTDAGVNAIIFPGGVNTAISYTFFVPEIPNASTAEIRYYWYTSSTSIAANTTEKAIFHTYYNFFDQWTSGVSTFSGGRNYVLSGAAEIVTKDKLLSSTFICPNHISGAITSTVINIPRADVRPGRLIKAKLVRNTALGIVAPVNLIGIKIDFVDY